MTDWEMCPNVACDCCHPAAREIDRLRKSNAALTQALGEAIAETMIKPVVIVDEPLTDDEVTALAKYYGGEVDIAGPS